MTIRRYTPHVLTAVTLAVAFSLWAAEPIQSGNSKASAWEHLAFEHNSTDIIRDRELAKKINQLGNEGWEMFSVVNHQEDGTTRKTTFFFKRPKR